ncbi:MAG TPA: hypothetical protein VFT74_12310 [Isosphaeraceae bacterium]|nr:hypothetical protein [Isosphaeraceae bacterium]
MPANDSRPDHEPKPHRRDFVRALGLTGSVSLLGRDVSRAQEQEPNKPALAPEPTEADARMALIMARYGRHLDEEARQSVRRDVEAVIRRGNRMRAFELSNGDEPMPVFTPYRSALD